MLKYVVQMQTVGEVQSVLSSACHNPPNLLNLNLTFMDKRFKSFVSRLNYKSASFRLFPGFFSLYYSLCVDNPEFLLNTLYKQMFLILIAYSKCVTAMLSLFLFLIRCPIFPNSV